MAPAAGPKLRRIPDPPETRQFSEGLLAWITHTDLDYLFRALCCARAALRAAFASNSIRALLFLLWLAIAIMLACVQVVA